MAFSGNENSTFLSFYHHHIIPEWRANYVSYDGLKCIYKELKKLKAPDVSLLDIAMLSDINRIIRFVDSLLAEEDVKLREVLSHARELEAKLSSKSSKDKDEIEDEDMTVDQLAMDRIIRALYDENKNILKFLELNTFAIAKLQKKFYKISSLQTISPTSVDFASSASQKAFLVARNRLQEVQDGGQRIIDAYCSMFRKSFPELARAELNFDKDKTHQMKKTRIGLGFKLGSITAMIVWFIVASIGAGSRSLYAYSTPGLLVYTTVGNVLLFRLLWACNVFLWSKHFVNYQYILRLDVTKPNPYSLLEETSTAFLLFVVNLVAYFHICLYQPGEAINNLCPIFVILSTAGFALLQLARKDKKHNTFITQGNLFSSGVLRRCLSAPFSSVTFRDVYAADVLTSFTRAIHDGMFGLCWVVSGAVLKPNQSIDNFGSPYLQCTEFEYRSIVALLVVIPFWIRFLQCLRDSRDKRTLWPQAMNAMKYLSTISVVAYGLVKNTDDWTYYTLVVLTSLFKWLWDVIMDWDLFSNQTLNPWSSHFLLRNDLMYHHTIYYYAAIIADLVLRFVWVMSLIGTSSIAVIRSPPFNFCFGALEIYRRFMWGHFRMEYEHLKHLKKRAIGYVERKRSVAVLRSHATDSSKILMRRASEHLTLQRAASQTFNPPEESSSRSPGKFGVPARVRVPARVIPVDNDEDSCYVVQEFKEDVEFGQQYSLSTSDCNESTSQARW